MTTPNSPASFVVSPVPGDGRIQIVDGQGRIFRSLGKPTLHAVKAGLAKGCRPELSVKWELVAETSDPDESEECRGCEHCDGEGGHSVADSRRLAARWGLHLHRFPFYRKDQVS